MGSGFKDVFIINPQLTVVDLKFLLELICCPLLDLQWSSYLNDLLADFKIFNTIFVFVIRIFSQFVNSCLFDACFNSTGLRSIAVFFFPYMCYYCWFVYLSICNIYKVFFYLGFQISFCLSYIYIYIYIYICSSNLCDFFSGGM